MDLKQHINDYISACKGQKRIEIVEDMFVPDRKYYTAREQEIILSKTLYKEMLRYSSKNFDTDREILSIIGLLIGTYDDRVYIYRKTRKIEDIVNEIELHHLCLTANPKADGAFENIRYFLKNCQDSKLIDKEREFCNYLTSLRPRNALLWRHRVWLTKKFHTEKIDLEWANQWVSKHPQDCSAFFFIENFMTPDFDTISRAYSENTKLIFDMPGHESVWHHRRYLLQKLIDHFEIPEGWIESQSPIDNFAYPFIKRGGVQRTKFIYICDEFGIDINSILSRSDLSRTSVSFDLNNEDIIIGLARGDKFPSEAEKQMLAAEKHYRWLHFLFTRMIKNYRNTGRINTFT